MRYFILLCLLITGCATSETVIYNRGGIVYCETRVDKPVTVTPSLQADGNTVPMMP
jgi:hypothetical protein